MSLQSMSEKVSELYQGAKDSAAEADAQTKAEYEKAGKYGHQVSLERNCLYNIHFIFALQLATKGPVDFERSIPK